MKLILAKWPDCYGLTLHWMPNNYTPRQMFWALDEIGDPTVEIRWIELTQKNLYNHFCASGLDLGAYHYEKEHCLNMNLGWWDRLFRRCISEGFKVFHMQDYLRNANQTKLIAR